jgi:adenine-specific DNA-methyltransferase
MSDLSHLILSLTPEHGSSIGNGAMMALLRERVPSLTDEDYSAARDAVVDDGQSLARGAGYDLAGLRPQIDGLADQGGV